MQNITKESERSYLFDYEDVRGNILFISPQDSEKIEELIEDVRETIGILKDTIKRSYHTRKYYEKRGLAEDYEKLPWFDKPHVSLVVNQEFEDYWGAGSANIMQDGVKVFWFTRDKVKEKLKQSIPVAETLPPAVLAHELLHTYGSSVEFYDPISETVALRFGLRDESYLTYEALSFYISYPISGFFLLRGRKLHARETLRLLYKENPEIFKKIVDERSSPQEGEKLLKELNVKSGHLEG